MWSFKSQVQSSQLISKTYLKVVHRKLICEGMDICEEEAKIFYLFGYFVFEDPEFQDFSPAMLLWNIRVYLYFIVHTTNLQI